MQRHMGSFNYRYKERLVMNMTAEYVGKGKCGECEENRDLYRVELEEICFKCLETREDKRFE